MYLPRALNFKYQWQDYVYLHSWCIIQGELHSVELFLLVFGLNLRTERNHSWTIFLPVFEAWLVSLKHIYSSCDHCLVRCLHYKKYSVCFKFLVTLLSFWKAWLAKTSLAGMEYGRVAQILSGYIFLKIVEKTLPNLVHLFTYEFFNINRLGNREIYLINLHG